MSRLLLLGAMIALFLGLPSGAHAQSTAPTILSVAITSNPGSDDTYGTGDIITVSLTFSEAVTVDTTNGTPYVVLSVGGDTGYADYSGDGSSAVVQPFSFTVHPLARDADGVFLRANSLDLYDGTIQATDDSADADLDHPGMHFPNHKVAAGGEVNVGLAQVGIPVVTALRNDDRITSNEAWQWQLSATEDGAYSDIPAAEGGTSVPYTPAAGDLGMWLKATVTYDDATGTGWTGEATSQVLSQATLSNGGYTHHNLIGFAFNHTVPHLYAQRFTTGPHTRGYRLTAVRLALDTYGGTAAGTWAVHADDAGKPAAVPVSAARPILTTDLDEEIHTFEEFTHPDGVHLDPDTKYWIVISQTTPVADGIIGVSALEDWSDNLPLVEGFDPNSEDEEKRDFCKPPLGSEREELCTPPADPGSEEGWSINIPALVYHWDDPNDPSDDPDATYPPDHSTNPNELIHDPALLPWQLFATGLQLSEKDRFVLRMSLVAPPVVTVQFGASDYTVDEGNSVSVEVELSSDPKSTITIPITTMGEGGATSADYSVPTSVTFNRGETTKTVTFTPTQDAVDDDGESVKLGFGTMPHSGVSTVTPNETTVSITDDDDPEVTVMFGQATYTVDESDDTSTTGVEENKVEVTLTLSADPERTVVIPIETAGLGGATDADYSVPSSVTFNAEETEKTITFTATHDTVDDDGERVRLSFGTPPDRVSAGTRDETTVSITDDDDPEVTVMFGQATYTVDESDDTSTTGVEENKVEVTLTLSADPERTVVIPIETAELDGATGADYSVPSSVTFNAGDTSKSFVFTAADDSIDDDGERVRLSFGTPPDRVSEGARYETTVSITDDDYPILTVQFGQDSQGVGEGETVNVTITLSANPERTVTIPITSTGQDGATSTDYSVPSSVTFNEGETLKTVAFMAVEDDDDDDNESVKLGFGSALPARVTAGTRTETTLNIGDDDDPVVTVMFAQTTHTVDEGDTQQVTVSVSADPERTIIIPIETTHQGTASGADYSGVPPSVTFDSGETSKTFDFAATQDEIDDGGEGVKLGFGTMPDPRVSAGTPDEVTVTITDDDTADIVLSPTALTVGEGESESYTVRLDTEPTVDVTVTISGHAGTDLTLAGTRLNGDALTFTPDNWSTPQTVTVTAGHDLDGVNDNETLTHTAGGGEYAHVESVLPATVNDDDPPDIVLSRLELMVEESDSASYGVSLATEPTVAVAVTITGLAGTVLSLSGPTLSNDALTFTAANWNTPQTVTVTAAHDTDTANDTETLTHTSTGGEYTVLTRALPVTVDDNTGDLRLVDGDLTDEDGQLCEGRLEIYYNGAWGTICDDYWTKDDADVACRALGFVASVEDYNRYRTAYFGPGTAEQEIVLDDLFCTGNESGLLECPSNHPGPGIHNCRHSEDVSLRCLKVGESPPWIIDVEFSGPPGGNGVYDAGETIEATLVWSEPVTVSTPSGGLLPKVWVLYGSGVSGHSDIAEYASGSGTDRTVFRYTLQSGSYSLVGVAANSLWERDGSIVSVESGQDAELGHSSYYSAQSENQAEAVTIIGVPAFNDPGPDNAWGAGEAVEVTFTFSRPVQVDTTGGAPSLPVALSGTATRQALYLRGSGARQLVFGYTLAEADGTHSSLLVAPDSLALNGGSIQDVDSMLDAAVEHQGAGAFYVQQVVDETAPELQSAAVDGATLTLTYNEYLDTGVTLPASAFAVNVNEASRSIDSASVSGSAVTLTLATAVESGDTVTADYTVPTGESANKLQDASGNTAESFSGQAVTNNSASSGTPRTVPPPAPGVPNSLNVARHESGKLLASWNAPDSGPAPTGYTVQWKESGDDWDDADDVSEASVKGTTHVITGLTDGVQYAVRVVANNGDAESAPTGEVTATPQETTPPSPSSVSVNGATLTVTFDEALDTGETPDNSAFAVTVAGSSRGVDTVSVSGSVVTLTLVTAVFAGEAVTLDYTAPSGESAVGLQDLAGNAAAAFSGQDTTNNSQAAAPFTASVSVVPESHDGSTVFTFELRFSETPRKRFGYKIMRDSAFTVTGGEVIKARRLARRSNVGWEIHVRPDGNGPVTIVLPVTTDCTAEGAICTEDRRPLSNCLEITVPAPGG